MRLQLDSRRSPRRVVAGPLFAATASLLGAWSGPSIAQEADKSWTFDTSASYYVRATAGIA